MPIKNSSARSREENSTDEPRTLETLRERKLAEGYTESDDIIEARREIRLSMALAQAVYDRRSELGLTQADLAERSGLTQAKISRIEGSNTVPTLPLLAKLADALDTTLNIALDADDKCSSQTTTPT
ncbi:helix-turn-helix domain-containing protein [Nocardia brasiliensis]|uniref:helix-turn-helix domain-containing protein n=1 Tax=Nocardia brasiliensis TaxID=37326 RepID=UPI0032AFE544